MNNKGHGMAFRFLTLLAVTVLLSFSYVNDAHAKKGFWESMLGWAMPKDNSPDPAKTLRAPFSYGEAETTGDGSVKINPSSNVPLQHAHTNHSVIAKWVITAVSDSLSYNVNDKKNVYEQSKGFFTEAGLGQFRSFMINNNIEKVVNSGRFNIRSVVKEEPLLLNSQSVDNRFRWLFEVPLMVSYMESENFDYKEHDPVNQHIVLTVQVGRSDDADNDLGILIETWSGKSQKIDKN